MKIICCIALVAISLAYASVQRKLFSEELINEINSKQTLWKAGKNFDDSMTVEKFRGMLGLVRRSNAHIRRIRHDDLEAVPESFDSREQWPDCASIKEIADQSACGSCWAVATASSMSDRSCIASEGKNQPRISAKNIMACCSLCGGGCNGGYPYYAWFHWENGIVTGGLYNSSVGCQPYPFATCEHHGAPGDYPKCPSENYANPKCSKQCDTSETYELTYGKEPGIVGTESDIQKEIQKNGPLVADFDVYEDFPTYKSGIYQHTTGEYLGGHAVRIIGWGVEDGVKYWLVANSWNEDWGEKGLFKIIRGTNDCGFEDECSFGLPK